MTLRRACRILGSDRRGLAALEFALTAPVLLIILGGVSDFGLVMVGRSQLANAVAQGVQVAISAGPAVAASTISSAITNGATNVGLTPKVTATVSAPACYCITGTPAKLGTQSALSANHTCTATCPAPSTGPGVFVTITATYTYTALMPLYSKLTSPTVTQTTTARLL